MPKANSPVPATHILTDCSLLRHPATTTNFYFPTNYSLLFLPSLKSHCRRLQLTSLQKLADIVALVGRDLLSKERRVFVDKQRACNVYRELFYQFQSQQLRSPTTKGPYTQPCSTQKRYSPRRAHWLAFGSLPTWSARWARRIMSPSTSRTVLKPSSIKVP